MGQYSNLGSKPLVIDNIVGERLKMVEKFTAYKFDQL